MVWVVAKAKPKKQDDTNSRVRVAMVSTCTHKGLDRHVLTVGVIPGPHSQIGPLHWRHFTSRGFTWSVKSTLEKETS